MPNRTRPYLFYDTAISICSECYRRAEGKIVTDFLGMGGRGKHDRRENEHRTQRDSIRSNHASTSQLKCRPGVVRIPC